MADSITPSSSESVFAPHFVADADLPPQTPQAQPKKQVSSGKPSQSGGFESQFVDAANKVSKELGVDTSANDLADNNGYNDGYNAEPDPLGDAELEISPGKRIKRQEIAQKLAQFEVLQKKQKEFERASHQRMQQAAEQRKQADAQLQQAQQAIQIQQRLQHLLESGADEDTILREFGRDPDKYFQSKIERQYQDMQKTPEQRQLEAFQQREHAIRQREEQIQREHQQREEQVRQYQAKQAVDNHVAQLSQAFMQTSDKLGLPKTALTIQRFANLMSAAEQSGIQVSMDQLGEQVRQLYKQETISMLENLSNDEDFQALPKSFQDKYRRSMLSKLGNQSASVPAPTQAAPRTRQQRSMSTAEYNAYVSQLRTKGG